MRPFRATYTPIKIKVDESGEVTLLPDTDKSRPVLVLQVFAYPDPDIIATAIFIDSDNTLKEDRITRLTDCHSTEWSEVCHA